MLAGGFLDAAMQFSGRPSLVIGTATYTYRELAVRAGRIAAALDSIEGTSLDSTCVVIANRTIGGFTSILGALIAGHGYVPINPRFPLERAMAIVAKAKPSVVVADAAGADLARAIAARYPGVKAGLLVDGHEEIKDDSTRWLCAQSIEQMTPLHEPVGDSAQALAYLMFTSGSTGVPKGVGVRRRNVLSYLVEIAKVYPLAVTDRCTQFFDFGFDLSVHDMFCTWFAGACLYVPPDGRALLAHQLVIKNMLTVWFSSPSLLSELARIRRLEPNSMPSLRLVFVCGDVLTTDLAKRMAAAAPNARLVNLYGPTEATIAITHYEVTDISVLDHLGEVPIGEALPGQRATIIDGSGAEVRPGDIGELVLAGSQVVEGYWGNEAETARAFFNSDNATPARAYRTGDRVCRDVNYGLLFRGRRDQQVKIGGFRIELADIELAVQRAANGARAAAVVQSVESGGRSITVFVECADSLLESVRTRCAELLPQYMIPSRYISIGGFPVNDNGKIDRKRLKSLAEKAEAAADIAAVSTDIRGRDHIIAMVTRILLGHRRVGGHSRPNIGLDENILDHLDSISFINALLEIEEQFAIPATDFEEILTINRVVDAIEILVGHKQMPSATFASQLRGAAKPPLARGLFDVYIDVTRISRIDAHSGELSYRRHSVTELSKSRGFVDVAHYLFHGSFANAASLAEADAEIRTGEAAALASRDRIPALLELSPELFIAALLPLGSLRARTSDIDKTRHNWKRSLHALGLAAGAIKLQTAYRRSTTASPRVANEPLPASVLAGVLGRDLSEVEQSIAEPLFVILAEHSTNTASFVARVAASTEAEFFGCLAAATATFSGPRHGGATAAVMRMIGAFAADASISDSIRSSIAEIGYLPGFGHRVYRTIDERTPLLRAMAEGLVADGRDDAPLRTMDAIVEEMRGRRKFGVFPNVDCYAGVVFTLLGVVPVEATAVFSLARMAGWCAHIEEQSRDNILIAPLLHYVDSD